MSRPLRIELAGGVYHVTSRGDRREAIYLDDTDRLAWLTVFAHVCQRFNWVCHSWCQMTNHYHIVVETPEGNLAAGMRQLNGVYTQQINGRHDRVGHVFQGRYKAILVERDRYLLELSRYVVLNPVRASMVADPADWSWSAYGAMIGRESVPKWLNTDWVLAQFGEHRGDAVARYIDFVRAGVNLPSVWEQLRGQVFLGSAAFIERALATLNLDAIHGVPQAQRRPLALPLIEYATKHTDRQLAMAAAYTSGDYTLQQIADFFGVHSATVSRAVKRYDTPKLLP